MTVRLTRIYTRTGDAGQTHLGDMSRVAKTDPRLVYFPEPNTFLKVSRDLDSLERDASFGEGKLEGQRIVTSLLKQRPDDPANRPIYDSRLAVLTDGRRVTGDATASSGQPAQSHARAETWRKQVEHFATHFGAGPLSPESERRRPGRERRRAVSAAAEGYW